MPYRLSALAERDLDEIWTYVAEDASPTIADRFIDDIIDRFDLLAEQPGTLCSACPRPATTR
ncbi:MAG: type II toxin-antitoxin system RelE/ParE family toxin [Vicinamibacterales bacterium]